MIPQVGQGHVLQGCERSAAAAHRAAAPRAPPLPLPGSPQIAPEAPTLEELALRRAGSLKAPDKT